MATLGEYERMTGNVGRPDPQPHAQDQSEVEPSPPSRRRRPLQREPQPRQDMREAFLALTGRGLRVYSGPGAAGAGLRTGARQDARRRRARRHLNATCGVWRKRAQEPADALLLGGNQHQAPHRLPLLGGLSRAHRAQPQGPRPRTGSVHLMKDRGERRSPRTCQEPPRLVPALEMDDGPRLTQSLAIIGTGRDQARTTAPPRRSPDGREGAGGRMGHRLRRPPDQQPSRLKYLKAGVRSQPGGGRRRGSALDPGGGTGRRSNG